MPDSLEDYKDVLPNPIEIVRQLDEYIIGQERAKKMLALMLLNRGILKLARNGHLNLDVPLEKSNVLLLGPTGSGKTGLMRALSEIADINITIFDVTSITAGAYIGNKVEDILVKHVNNCVKHGTNLYEEYKRYSIEDYTDQWITVTNDKPDIISKEDFIMDAIETGIIYLDEVDKIKARSSYDNIDPSGDMVQNELLKIIEEGEVSLQPARSNPSVSIRSVNTKNITFICGGAFSGLSEIIEKRLGGSASIGFNSDIKYKNLMEKDADLFKYVVTQDLIKYGLKPEFLGRLPLKAILEPLSIEVLMSIIEKPKNSVLAQYQGVFKVFNIDLSIEKDALREIAVLAQNLKIGARSLKTIFSNLLLDHLYNVFDYPDKKFVITKELVKNKGEGTNV